MAINAYNIRKWTRMLTGRSILHVNQGVGRNYQKYNIAGYYNDLTEKVTRAGLEEGELPLTSTEKNKSFYFPIAVFQYGLGAYDLFLQTKDEKYLKIVKLVADWAVENQNSDGGWGCFCDGDEENTYSSMGQGEGVSLLIRARKEYNEKKYEKAIKDAVGCMIKPVDDGGTMLYDGDTVIFKEFPEKPVVLNGWIFSIFGLYDYLLMFSDDKRVKEIYNKTIETLEEMIKEFDLGYWSKYDAENKVASPFYHRLHISLLIVLYDLTNMEEFRRYSDSFEAYYNNRVYKYKAFIKKSFQKVMER